MAAYPVSRQSQDPHRCLPLWLRKEGCRLIKRPRSLVTCSRSLPKWLTRSPPWHCRSCGHPYHQKGRQRCLMELFDIWRQPVSPLGLPLSFPGSLGRETPAGSGPTVSSSTLMPLWPARSEDARSICGRSRRERAQLPPLNFWSSAKL